jgi:thioredoxin 1
LQRRAYCNHLTSGITHWRGCEGGPAEYYKEMGMTEQGGPITVTDGNFAEVIEEGQGLVIVDFWAAWCGPCRMVAPIIEQLAGEYAGKLQVGKVDVDANQQISMKYNIRSIPSILFFKDGQHVDTVVGAVPKAMLERKIQEHLN